MSIKKVSKKMSKINSEYSKLRKEFLQNHPICHAKIYKCSLHATDVHHKKGRGIYHLDVNTWLPVCRSCHMWIEVHPLEASELGFSESKII
tara:strand:+ start:441 stop:713 length:273 start_codon:yes stop_codon:yes gene_type:complete